MPCAHRPATGREGRALQPRMDQRRGRYGTHQEDPLELVLDILHAGKGGHPLDHFDEDASHTPEARSEDKGYE